MHEKVVLIASCRPRSRWRAIRWMTISLSMAVWKIEPCCSRWRRRAMELTRLPLWATLRETPLWVARKGWVLTRLEEPVVE